MSPSQRIKVLIVDASPVFREIMARGLASEPQIRVIGTAEDPYDAKELIEIYEPDVMVCDMELPRMKGGDFIRRLLPQYPIPIVVVSSLMAGAQEAIRAGAIDYVPKPVHNTVSSVEPFLMELIQKVTKASEIQLGLRELANDPRKQAASTRASKPDQDHLIVIGASTGGTEALASLLRQLPPTMPGIAIVQHIPPFFSSMFANRLNSYSELEVKEACGGELLGQGKVLLAPGDKHIRIGRKVTGKYIVECVQGEKVNGHCPSVDVLFESAAKEAGALATGVILTGMGNDGAKGLMSIRRAGGRTLGQDPDSCVVYGMPRAAYELGAVEKQLPLDGIARTLIQMFHGY